MENIMNRRVIDLSYAMQHQMEVFPGDPPVGILTHHFYKNGYFVSQVLFGTHSGTHVDAPIHKIPDAQSITDLPVDCYIGWHTAVLDFTDVPYEITKKDCMKYDRELEGCDAVIFRTGWESQFSTGHFFEGYPGLHEDVAEYLEKKKIHLIGLETPSVHPVRHGSVHTELLKRGICIVESLANVSSIREHYVELHAVPLRLKDLDGSPVRAYAVESY